ncbi:MAG: hypothetical protein GY765_03885, partial [bacterium]|nr:hypothetical protein [bacterium]
MKSKWLLMVIFCLTLFTAPLLSDIPQTERDALIALYNSTGGDNWKNNSNWRNPGDPTQFNVPGTENTWYGVTCDAGATKVEAIDLSSNDLSGPIPAEINNLTQLNLLKLEWNQLSGSPPNMAGLTALQQLTLRRNSLSGTIPTWLNNLTGLTVLELDNNGFTGAIPDMGSLVNLAILDMRGNQLSGAMPAWLNNLVQLQRLYLNENQLTGPLVSLTDLTNLVYLILSDNQFTGSIPTWISQFPQLKSLHLSENQFTGNIPDLQGLTALQSLNLGGNQLTGPIPAWLNAMATITDLRLDANQFSGAIPDLGGLTGMFALHLNDNQLTGPLPSWLANMTNLHYLYMGNNNLSGTIDVVGSLPLLSQLHLNNNNFNGNLPAALGNLTALNSLSLNDNRFIGRMPSEIGNLVNVVQCKLQGNALSGPIPTTITNCTKLLSIGLDINWNCLSTADETVRSFVDSRHFTNWENTQTIAPSDIYAGEEAGESVKISWTPIAYQSDGGGYRVLYSTTSGSGYLEAGITADKSIDNYTVTGLTADTDYYFVVETETPAHSNNGSIVVSEESAEVTATTGNKGITVTAPNGGENIFMGSSYDITWTHSGAVDNVILYFSDNGGVDWQLLDGPLTNTGTYTWLVPNFVSPDYMVKVEDETGGAFDTSDAVFEVKPPEITVTAPNGGEEFFMGTPVTVTWTSAGDVENVVLSYSTDNGEYWEPIAGPIANTGSYEWTLPNMPCPEYLVKVEEENGFMADTNDGYFEVKPPEITVTSPMGGESFFMGTPITVTWTSAGVVDNVVLSYSTDRGEYWEPIVGPIPNTGSYEWVLPNMPHWQYSVYVEEEHGFVSGSNPNFFEVKPPEITVTSPVGGEEFFMGTPITITWTSAGVVDNVVLYYSTDQGDTMESIAGPIPNTGSYEWVLPNMPHWQYSVYVEEEHGFVSGSNPNFFEVKPPEITVTSPLPAEEYFMGTPITITWTSAGLMDNVVLYYSSDGGNTRNPITGPIANNGTYDWTLPNEPSPQYFVYVEHEMGFVGDANDDYFIVKPPEITVTSP